MLLKLALGMPAALDRLSLNGVQRARFAAKNHNMLGPADILKRELCTHVKTSSMEVYVFPSTHGGQRAATGGPDHLIHSSIDFTNILGGHSIARLVCKRSERVRLFNDHLRSRATRTAFARENSGVCCPCAYELQLAASVRFSHTSAVDAVCSHPDVTAFAELKCSSCGMSVFVAQDLIDARWPSPM